MITVHKYLNKSLEGLERSVIEPRPSLHKVRYVELWDPGHPSDFPPFIFAKARICILFEFANPQTACHECLALPTVE